VRPEISEFSYGFALTSELLNTSGYEVTSAPVFASLYEEGQAGGGWDVRLDRATVPLFLQFKVSDHMVRSTCKEGRDGVGIPCYRMHLRPARVSQQHELLLELEESGQEVYYSAPAFHGQDQLNDAFLSSAVRARSIWVKPSDIGPLPDGKDDHVAFRPGEAWRFYSPSGRILNVRREFDDVERELNWRLDARGQEALERSYWPQLLVHVRAVAEKRRDIPDSLKQRAAQRLREVRPVLQVAYYASAFLESQLFLVQGSDEGAAQQ